MAVLSPMCRVTPFEQMGYGLSALGCAVKGSLRLFQVKVSKASKTAKRVSVHKECALKCVHLPFSEESSLQCYES